GIDSVQFTTTATVESNTGLYIIQPFAEPFDINDAADLALMDAYDYVFAHGILTIEKMPVTITPHDTAFVYGAKIGITNFNYDFDTTDVDASRRQALADSMTLIYETPIAEGVAFVDGKTSFN